MKLDVAAISEPGEREKNEDCVAVYETEHGICAVLCDGLGGHEAGELASACVCGSIGKTFQEDDGTGTPAQLVVRLLEKAQQDLLAQQRELDMVGGMRTTVCCLVIRGEQAAAAHVGDSRIYLMRKNKVAAVSEDHSIPMYLVKMGDIRRKDIRHHPDRNKVLRVMGSDQEEMGYQFLSLPKLKAGDSFLLCTDGFWEWIEENEMLQLRRGEPAASAWLEKMRQHIYKCGSGKHMDNLSAIAVNLGEPAAAGKSRLRDLLAGRYFQ